MSAWNLGMVYMQNLGLLFHGSLLLKVLLLFFIVKDFIYLLEIESERESMSGE